MTRNLDMMYTAVPSPKMEAAAAEILGPVWQAYVAEASQAPQRTVQWNGQTYEIQKAADHAAILKSRGKNADAQSLYEAICAEMPEHGDAHYHLAWLVVDEDIERALTLVARARKLLPGHPPYERAEAELLGSKGFVRVGEQIMPVQAAYKMALEREASAPGESREVFLAISKIFPNYNCEPVISPPVFVPPPTGRGYGERVINRAKSIGRRLLRP